MNEAAFKVLQRQDDSDLTAAMNASKDLKTPGGPTMPSPADPVKPVSKEDIPKTLEQKDVPKSGGMNQFEEEQMEIIRQMSMREEEERKKIQDEEEQILKQVLEMSSKEHQEETKKKTDELERKRTEDLQKKEDELKRKEAALKAEEKRIKKEKERLELKRKQDEMERKKKEKELAAKKPEVITPEAPKIVTAPVIPKKPNKKIIKENNTQQPLVDPNKPAEATYDLPPVTRGKNAAMMAADVDILREASNDIFGKGKPASTYDPYADDIDFEPWNKKEEGQAKTMAQMLKDKLSKMGASKEDHKQQEDQKESIEQRKQRLLEHRKNIVKQKQEAMKKELEEAREGNTDNKYSNNLFKEFMSLDRKVTQKEAKKKHQMDKEAEEPKPKEDDVAEVLGSKKPKRDMHSLFDSDDDDKEKEEAERKERHRKIMKQMAQENTT